MHSTIHTDMTTNVALKPEQSVLTDLFLVTLRGTFPGMRNSITPHFIIRLRI